MAKSKLTRIDKTFADELDKLSEKLNISKTKTTNILGNMLKDGDLTIEIKVKKNKRVKNWY